MRFAWNKAQSKNVALLLFLYGMFSKTQIQVVGYIGISELVVFAVAPFIWMQDRVQLKRDGYSTYLMLALLSMLGCVVSGFWNHCDIVNILKILATTYALFAHIVVLHRLLRKDPGQLKWIFLGMAISGVISIFIFQPGSSHVGAAVSSIGTGELSRSELTSSVTGYALFWVGQVNTWLTLPVKMFYLSTPFIYSFLAPLACAMYAIFSTSSGRSAFLGAMFGFTILFMGGKRQARMLVIKRNFMQTIILLLIAGAIVAVGYKTAAKSGFLGEEKRAKYERQNAGRKGVLGTLMGGRIEFFIGMTAALHHPFIGVGPKAEDKEGLVEYFMTHYGTEEDLKGYMNEQAWRIKEGLGAGGIPAHSHLASFWLWCGLPGLIFWCYALYLVYSVLRKYLWVVPQWFGYLALAIPATIWSIIFSPFGERTGDVLMLTCCLMVRAIARGQIRLQMYMIKEIEKNG